jgi:hypothetical protein
MAVDIGVSGSWEKPKDSPWRSTLDARETTWSKSSEEPKASRDGASDGVIQMTTTLARLLAKKQELIERLQENPGPEEREQIERLLEHIHAALDSLDKAGPGTGDWSMPHDPYVREKFTRSLVFARQLAREYF